MRELIADLFITVDGFAKGRNAPAYFGYGGPDLDAWIGEQLATPHVMLMGGNTYRAMSEIVATGADRIFTRMDELPKVVFSASLRPPLTWANTTLVSDDVAVAVPAMKAEPGDPLRVIGSVSLVRSLLRLGLVNRFRLMLFPQLLGETGEEPAFAGLPDINLGLSARRVLDERLVLLEYLPPGAPLRPAGPCLAVSRCGGRAHHRTGRPRLPPARRRAGRTARLTPVGSRKPDPAAPAGPGLRSVR